MDPVTAIGLAASVLSFVEFSWGLIKDAREIYRSVDGVLDENARTEAVIDDLDRISEDLSKAQLCTTSTPPERAVKRLGEACQEDSKKLLDHLKKLKVGDKRRPWNVVKAAFWSRMTRQDIADLKDNLDYYRSEIDTNLLLILRQEQSGVGGQLKRLQDECGKLQMRFTETISSIRQDAAKAIEASSTTEISQMLGKLQSLAQIVPVHHRILQQLIYRDYNFMRSRRSQIRDAGKETCGWILEHGDDNDSDGNNRISTSRAFRHWLREGKGVQHISGNAGAGKSTLTKFIATHDTTTQELQKWAGDRTLVLAEYYFYTAGNIMERTLPGLRRSLLFEMLSRCPDLMPLVFPTQWREFKAGPGDERVDSRLFTEADIKAAMEDLIRADGYGQYKFCFFIDGLDEYQGDGIENEEIARENMAEMLMKWADGEYVKICASSRPNREFHELFQCEDNPTIRLHLLNQPDISTYCVKRFREDRKASEITDTKPYMDLIQDIVRNSQGVFLWAYLVIDNLLADIRLDYSLETMKANLRQIPTTMEKLYDSLRNGLSKNSRRVSDKMLLLAAENPFKDPLYAIDFAWLEAPDDLADPHFPDIVNSHLYSEEEVVKKLNAVEARLVSLTKGMLEIVKDNRRHYGNDPPCPSYHGKAVQFFHRSARDYIIECPGRLQALRESFPRFDETYPYARLRLAEYSRVFRHTCSSGSPGGGERIRFENSTHFDLGPLAVMYPQYLGEIGRGFYMAIQQRLGGRRRTDIPYDVPCETFYNGVGFRTTTVERVASPVHYLALLGFTEFVLCKLGEEPQLKRTAGYLSLLISAIKGPKNELASELLRRGIELDDIVSVADYPRIRNKTHYPLWFVAAIAGVERFLWEVSRDHDWRSVDVLQRLIQHGTSKGEVFTISFTSIDPKKPSVTRRQDSFGYWQHLGASRSLRPKRVENLPVADLASFFAKLVACDEAHGAELSATPFFGPITFGAFLSLLLGGDDVYEGTIFHSTCGSVSFDTWGTRMATRVY